MTVIKAARVPDPGAQRAFNDELSWSFDCVAR